MSGPTTYRRPHRRSGASWLYVALIGLWLALRASFFDQIWWLALLNSFALYLFLPLPLLLTGALWRRRMVDLLGLAVPTIAFGVLFGTLLPRPSAPLAAQPSITAMSFNVLTSNKDTVALVDSIRAAQPDILGMQELTSGKRDALKAALGQQLPYHTLEWPRSDGNVGLMTRFPIEAAQPISLPTGQPALHAILRVGQRRLHVLVAHLSPNHLFKDPTVDLATATTSAYTRRAAEVARLVEELRRLDAPAILVCDCNMTDTSQAHAGLQALLIDSFREAGWGLRHTNYTSGVPFPTQRIDYIWHSAGLAAVTAAVGQPGGSDHLPVVARLGFEQ